MINEWIRKTSRWRMAVATRFTQIAHEVPSASKRKTALIPFVPSVDSSETTPDLSLIRRDGLRSGRVHCAGVRTFQAAATSTASGLNNDRFRRITSSTMSPH